MAATDQYIASIVEKYHVEAEVGSAAHRAADEVIPIIKRWGKQHLVGITLSGAYAKNTAAGVSSDVDVLVTLNPIPGIEINNLFWKLFEYLMEQNLQPRSRNVSVQVEARGLRVDLIPAYRDQGSSRDILYNKKSGKEVQTEVARHVHLVANSGRQQEICAFKIWRERNKLEFPSLLLELTVLRALGSDNFGQLADNSENVLRFLGNRFEEAIVRDPANSKNVVSNDLSKRKRRLSPKRRATPCMRRTGRSFSGKSGAAQGLKPANLMTINAALKRRSSTVRLTRGCDGGSCSIANSD